MIRRAAVTLARRPGVSFLALVALVVLVTLTWTLTKAAIR